MIGKQDASAPANRNEQDAKRQNKQSESTTNEWHRLDSGFKVSKLQNEVTAPAQGTAHNDRVCNHIIV